MSGIPHFKLDCYIPFTDTNEENYGNQIFKLTWDFFKQLETAGYCTEIARNNGKAATFSPKSLGTGFYDELTPFGETSWAVFRFEPSDIRPFTYCIHFQWSSNSLAYNTAPGNPGLIDNSAGTTAICFGFSMAAAFDSSGNSVDPFIPASGSMGSHIKSDPVWTTPVGGTLFVFPLSNNTGFTHATSKQNTTSLLRNIGSTQFRMNFVADRDNWFASVNYTDALYDGTIIGGGFIVTPPNITAEVPLFFFKSRGNDFFSTSVFWGSSTGDDTVNDGGCACIKASGVNSFTFDWELSLEKIGFSFLNNTDVGFSLYPATITYNKQQIGWADPAFWRLSYNTFSRDSSMSMTRMFFQGANTSTICLVIPWDGTTERTSNFTRNGVISP